MARENLQIEAGRFTTSTALAKEVIMLLTGGDIELIVFASGGSEESLDRIANDLSGRDGIELVRLDKKTLLFQRKEPPCQPTS